MQAATEMRPKVKRPPAKSAKKAEPTSALEAGVAAALEVWRRLHPADMPTFPDDRNDKYAFPLYFREACRAAARKGALPTIEHLRAVEHELRENAAAGDHTYIDTFRGNARRLIRAVRVDKGCALTPIVGNLHLLLNTHDPSSMTGLRAECTEYSTTPAELLAIEVLLAGEEAPEVFGRITMTKAESDALERELDRACAEIRWTDADCDFEMIDAAQGIGRIVFLWRGEKTPVAAHPPESAGRRLLEWVAAQR